MPGLARADSTLAEAVPLRHGGSGKPDHAAALFAMADSDRGFDRQRRARGEVGAVDLPGRALSTVDTTVSAVCGKGYAAAG